MALSCSSVMVDWICLTTASTSCCALELLDFSSLRSCQRGNSSAASFASTAWAVFSSLRMPTASSESALRGAGLAPVEGLAPLVEAGRGAGGEEGESEEERRGLAATPSCGV